ncbi:MAG: hypothetical protein QW698_07470 [Nitrososphaerales archaeon]
MNEDRLKVKVYGAVETHNPKKAPEDYEWDADRAEKRIRAWSGGPEKENIDWSKYRQGFAWYDEKNPENFESYKLPHHDIIDNELCTVWRGVVAAAGAIMGARGGVDIPNDDLPQVKAHIANHYHQFDKRAPWEIESVKMYSFSWLPRPITEDEVKALRLVKGVAIHAGLSKKQPIADKQTEDNLMRGGRSLRGALIDIDHASVMSIDQSHYKEKYGLESLFPIGQVLDAEYEDERVEFIASIWDDKVYDMILQNKFKGCSVVEEYRSEIIEKIDGLVSITQGSTFPLLALCLESEPAYPNTWVKPLTIEEAITVDQAKIEPLTIEVRIPNTDTMKKYSLTSSGIKIETVKLKDKTELEDVIEEINKKIEALKDEIRQIRDEKQQVEKEIQALKEDHAQLMRFGKEKPTALIEAYPSRQVKGNKCNHSEFLKTFPMEQDLRSFKSIPSDYYLSWALSVERNCSYEDGSHCPHYQLIRPHTISAKQVILPRVNQETALSFIRIIRNVLSKEI